MIYRRSIYDKLTSAIAPVARTLFDVNVEVLGTKTKVLRVSVSSPDILGNVSETYTSGVINNVTITHPLGSNVLLFAALNQSTQETETKSVDLWEVLPFTMRVPFTGTFSEEAVAVQNGDFIVDVLYDENDNALPLIFQVTKTFGGFMNKYIITKKYELALFRGNVPADLQSAIDTYIATL